jgi:hypothetical protein
LIPAPPDAAEFAPAIARPARNQNGIVSSMSDDFDFAFIGFAAFTWPSLFGSGGEIGLTTIAS